MGCTSSKCHVMLVDACGNKFQTQKSFGYKNLDAELQIYFASTASGLGSGFEWWLCHFLLSATVMLFTYSKSSVSEN